jgi:membrane-associated protease RseP (regulator of RpoE activity)
MLAALALGLAAPAAAQERPVALSCSAGAAPVGDLGYSGLSCNCTHYYDEDDPSQSVWRFRSEPRIEGVKRGGPAEGRLRRGDLVVAIDGVLITSDEGGRRFARIQPGRPVTLTVRRDGREHMVEITPSSQCPAELPTPVAAPAAPGPTATPKWVQPPPPSPAPRAATPKPIFAPRAVVPSVPPPPDFALRAWFGFSLRCSQCGWSRTDGETVWEFSDPPVVEQVEPDGPAAHAGLRDGDRITQIDGLDVTTAEAGRRFGAARPGEPVAFQVLREDAALTVRVTPAQAPSRASMIVAGNRLATRITPSPAPTPLPEVERYTGTIGDALVQVTGAPVSVTQTDDEIVIRSADVTVRIRKTK